MGRRSTICHPRCNLLEDFCWLESNSWCPDDQGLQHTMDPKGPNFNRWEFGKLGWSNFSRRPSSFWNSNAFPKQTTTEVLDSTIHERTRNIQKLPQPSNLFDRPWLSPAACFASDPAGRMAKHPRHLGPWPFTEHQQRHAAAQGVYLVVS